MTNDRRNARNGKGPSPNYRGQNHRGQNYRGQNQRGAAPPQQRGPQPAVKAPPPPPAKAPAHHPPRPVQGVPTQGVLELHPKGYGFLRSPARFYAAQPSDAYVPAPLIQRFALREGLLVAGLAEDARKGTTGPRLLGVDHIEGAAPSLFNRRDFDELTPIDPDQRIVLETGAEPLTTRVMDLLTPIGKGQRGLIVAPPRTGKTVLLQHIAAAVSQNHPEMHLMVLLVDERPEEVTDIRRNVKGEVIASSSDRDTMSHVRTAELVMERAKRLAESGRQVFVLLDSLTRLARAYNKTSNTGRTMSGGMDVRAMDIPKKLFGAARAFEEGGSLTIMGTALVDTGSRMDELIFQEFKGTGNMELVLDRKLADRRVFPALDISQSGTRKEERLMDAETLRRVTLLRRTLVQMKPVEAMEMLVKQLAKHKSNAEFLDRIALNVR